jgi:guanylate kinase
VGAKPRLFVLSGPSGAGKDSVLSQLKQRGLPLHFVVTVTTRPPRPGEVTGKDYHFVSESRFQELRDKGELVEWAQVYGHSYGVPRWEIEEGWGQGKDVIVKVDIQGAVTLKQLYPEAILIFLTTPSFEELARRLRERRTETPFDLDLRLKTAFEEMKHQDFFDYNIVNSRLDKAVDELEAIIKGEVARRS